MTSAQAPQPDLSFLAGLDPGVAYAALAVIVIAQILYFVGPSLRDRVSRRPDPPAVEPAPAPSPAAAVDRAGEMSREFITFLQGQLRDTERERDDALRRLDRVERELAREQHGRQLDRDQDRQRYREGS